MNSIPLSGVTVRLQSLLVLLLLCVLLLFIGGCWGTLNEQFVKAVDSNWNVMGPDYTAYVQADEALPEKSKERRLKAIAEFTLLIKEAKAKIEE